MTKQIWQPTTLLAPLPAVLVSSGTVDTPNVMTVAWTGIVNTKPAMTYISLQPIRHTYDIVKETGEFVINLVPDQLVRKTDFCGVRSGRDTDKFAECGFTPERMEHIAAPAVAECPVNLECRVTQTIPLGSHEMFLAEILAVHVDAACIDPDGAFHVEKCHLASYAHGAYFAPGKKIGTFGFSVRKKVRKPVKKQ